MLESEDTRGLAVLEGAYCISETEKEYFLLFWRVLRPHKTL